MTPGAKHCPDCSRGTLRRRTVDHVENVGKVKVRDTTAFALVCDECGDYDLAANDLAAYQRRAAAIVLRDGRFVKGAVVRYARKALGLRQVDLAVLLHKSAENISRWETGDIEIPRAEQLAVMACLDAAERGIDVHEWVATERLPNRRRGRAELDVPPIRQHACG
jgi:DNA-binding transcriptional regulator YiaG